MITTYRPSLIPAMHTLNLNSAVHFLVRCDNLTQRRGERGDFRTNEHDTQCLAVTKMVDKVLEIQVAVTCQSHRLLFSASLRDFQLTSVG